MPLTHIVSAVSRYRNWLATCVVGVVAPFALMALATVAQADKTPVVENVRVGQHKLVTRVVLESDMPLDVKLFTLPNPDRVVLDMPTTKFKQDLPNVTLPPSSLVTRMRQGAFKPGVTRMVIDMSLPVAVTKFAIPANGKFKHRLVLDLSPTTQHDDETSLTERVAKAEPKPLKSEPTVTIKQPGAPIVVMLDPGHGGVDPGAVTRRGKYEKNVVLAVAKYIKDELRGNPNVEVYLTRDDDTFIPLQERVRKAQLKKADIFVSLHADANLTRTVRGATVYSLSDKASDSEAARLARHANEGDLIAGVDMRNETPEVRDILIDLTQRETMNRSVFLGQSIMGELGKVAYLRKKEVLFAGFRVLKAPEIPSVLVELGYMSNPTEEQKLLSTSYQRELAASIAEGIELFAKNHVHH